MSLQVETLKLATLAKIEEASDPKAVNQIRVEALGKKGPITEVLRGMKDLSPEERFSRGLLPMKSEQNWQAIEAKNQALEAAVLNSSRSHDVTFQENNCHKGLGTFDPKSWKRLKTSS